MKKEDFEERILKKFILVLIVNGTEILGLVLNN